MEKVKFGIIGAGLWGEMHARTYWNHPLVEIGGVCDMNEARAKQIAAQYEAEQHYTDYRALLKRDDIAAVSIVTPDFAHTEIAVAAARAGKHILLEKPMATTVADCEKILSEVARTKVTFMVDFHTRWSPPFVKAKKAIEEGEIGDPLMIDYRLSDTIYVPTKMLSWAGQSSVLWFIGSHCIDTISWLLEDRVARVYAVSRSKVLASKGIDTPDFFQTILEFKKGAVANLENCWVLPERAPNLIDLKCEIVGSHGVLYMDGSHHRMLQKYTQKEATYPDVFVCPVIYEKATGFAFESIRHFIDCVLFDHEPMIPHEAGLEVTKVIVAMLESARSGMPVSVA